ERQWRSRVDSTLEMPKAPAEAGALAISPWARRGSGSLRGDRFVEGDGHFAVVLEVGLAGELLDERSEALLRLAADDVAHEYPILVGSLPRLGARERLLGVRGLGRERRDERLRRGERRLGLGRGALRSGHLDERGHLQDEVR